MATSISRWLDKTQPQVLKFLLLFYFILFFIFYFMISKGNFIQELNNESSEYTGSILRTIY